MGGSTFKCSKCAECVRVSSEAELYWEQDDHNKSGCDGAFISVWINYDKMTSKEKENIINQVMFKHGKIGKVRE